MVAAARAALCRARGASGGTRERARTALRRALTLEPECVIALVLLVVWQGAGVLDTFLHPLSGMLALVPTIIHSYSNDAGDDGRRTTAIPTELAAR